MAKEVQKVPCLECGEVHWNLKRGLTYKVTFEDHNLAGYVVGVFDRYDHSIDEVFAGIILDNAILGGYDINLVDVEVYDVP